MNSFPLELGRVVVTPGAMAALREAGVVPWELLARHARGDWGEVPPEDARENELSLKHGFRVLSSYPLSTGETLWILTEGDRSSTCLLKPSEY